MHARTAIVTAHNHVLDAQHIDGELQHGQAVQVGMHYNVGDITVDEQLSRQQINDFVRRHTTVGTSYPQIFR